MKTLIYQTNTNRRWDELTPDRQSCESESGESESGVWFSFVSSLSLSLSEMFCLRCPLAASLPLQSWNAGCVLGVCAGSHLRCQGIQLVYNWSTGSGTARGGCKLGSIRLVTRRPLQSGSKLERRMKRKRLHNVE